MSRVSVHFVALDNFSGDQTHRANQVRTTIEGVVNSPAFQQRVLDAQFSDARLERRDGTVVRNMTNAQILEVILTGAELETVPDAVIGLKVSLYHKLFSSAIGWTDVVEGRIHTRDRFFNGGEVVDVAAHWLHEWCHVAGFVHDYNRTTRRERSVPYLVGEILAECAAA